MPALYNYKIWNPNLSQFVAQPDMLPADQIHALGGIIIVGETGPASPPPAATRRMDELTAAH